MKKTVALVVIVFAGIAGPVFIFQRCKSKNAEKLQSTEFIFKEKLSEYGFFKEPLNKLVPATRLLNYELVTPLFTDYAIKDRFIVLPSGGSIQFKPQAVFDFPDSTIIIKNFAYRNAANEKTMIETRLLVKDPFDKKEAPKEETKKEEKIVMVLTTEEPKSPITTFALPVDEREEDEIAEEKIVVKEQPAARPVLKVVKEEKIDEVKESLQPTLIDFDIVMGMPDDGVFTNDADSKNTGDNKVEKNEPIEKFELVYSLKSDTPELRETLPTQKSNQTTVENNSPASAVSGGYLAKPSNIYAQPHPEPVSGIEQTGPLNEPVSKPVEQQPSVQKEEEPSFDMQLVMKDEPKLAADESRAPQSQEIVSQSFTAEEPALRDEAEEQRQRAAERIQKLRNLSFNINAADPNNEFETVPAYIRRNLELYNTISSVENFYSSYEVKKEDDDSSRISTINTFLDGKKPD